MERPEGDETVALTMDDPLDPDPTYRKDSVFVLKLEEDGGEYPTNASTTTDDSTYLIPGAARRDEQKKKGGGGRQCCLGSRIVERTIFAVVVLTLLYFLMYPQEDYRLKWRKMVEKYSSERNRGAEKRVILKYDHPRPTFRENLLDDLAYVTAGPYGGLTNQLLSMFKLVYVARMLDREAILPELNPEHDEGGYAKYSEFFDMEYFSQQTSVALVEWGDVKTHANSASTQREDLSCWGQSWPTKPFEKNYNVYTSFWPYPTELVSNHTVEMTTTFPGIEILNSEDHTSWFESKQLEWFGRTGQDVGPRYPDQHLLCFQNLFYVANVKFVQGAADHTRDIEELPPDGPIWNQVGQHLHFLPRIQEIVDDYLERLLPDGRKKKDQPFIGVHLRQGDFLTLNRTTKEVSKLKERFTLGLEELYSNLTTYKPTLLEERGIEDVRKLPILLATDSNDTTLLTELSRFGWTFIDHGEMETVEKYGGWYPGVLDSAILSRAIGLVGTKLSTFSYLAERRIESFNGGLAVIVG